MPSLGSYGPVGGVVWPLGQAALSRNQLFQLIEGKKLQAKPKSDFPDRYARKSPTTTLFVPQNPSAESKATSDHINVEAAPRRFPNPKSKPTTRRANGSGQFR